MLGLSLGLLTSFRFDDGISPYASLLKGTIFRVLPNSRVRLRNVLKSGFSVAAEQAVRLSPVSQQDQMATSVVL